MLIIDDILFSPIKGLYSLCKVINDRIEEEMYNPEKIQEELMKLQLQLDMEEITEEEYDEKEEILIDRLVESKKRVQ